MQDVFGMSCDPRPARHPARNGAGVRRFAYVILHLLVELGSRLDSGDPAGAVSVLLGAAAVLVTLLPFAVLFALRARKAWLGGMAPDGRPEGPALAPGRR